MANNFETRDEDVALNDYRAYFEDKILRVWHLNGKKITVRITRVTKLTSEVYDVKTRSKEVQVQPKLELANRAGKALSLPLLLNKTNAKTISGLYGKRPSEWVGKLITLYPTQVEVGGEVKDGIRIENTPPPEAEPAKAGNGKRNKQGVTVLPAQPAAQVPAKPAAAQRVTVDEDGVVHDGDPYTDPDNALTEAASEREPGDDTDEPADSEPPPGALSTDRDTASLIT